MFLKPGGPAAAVQGVIWFPPHLEADVSLMGLGTGKPMVMIRTTGPLLGRHNVSWGGKQGLRVSLTQQGWFSMEILAISVSISWGSWNPHSWHLPSLCAQDSCAQTPAVPPVAQGEVVGNVKPCLHFSPQV